MCVRFNEANKPCQIVHSKGKTKAIWWTPQHNRRVDMLFSESQFHYSAGNNCIDSVICCYNTSRSRPRRSCSYIALELCSVSFCFSSVCRRRLCLVISDWFAVFCDSLSDRRVFRSEFSCSSSTSRIRNFSSEMYTNNRPCNACRFLEHRRFAESHMKCFGNVQRKGSKNSVSKYTAIHRCK